VQLRPIPSLPLEEPQSAGTPEPCSQIDPPLKKPKPDQSQKKPQKPFRRQSASRDATKTKPVKKIIESLPKQLLDDGSIFDGSWLDPGDGELEKLKGIITYPDGGSYEGMFKNDLFEGQGTFIYGDKANHKKYVGGWREGKYSG
jgi:hypothetical protein